ncbi:hypothetical protein [Pseudalkalibacillus caeni]|uniref:Uncharacterized protein n=1 Tax=Exobacillus caeni TaxID=2574798 RepID=A0A5R9F5Z8_9BACL|nr:hypothetical protein [Pseudalkalibacillus caeni]TLS37919.1 hypothetical protein FCL54_08870 [Pseudalkalibacillus caeni]
MHSKHTVRYICEEYSSGNKYFYKQELITHDTWQNPASIQWSARRPITRQTFMKNKLAGFPVIYRHIKKEPGTIIPFRSKGHIERKKGRAQSKC